MCCKPLDHCTPNVRAVYLGSILATLYASLWMHSYILSLVCSGLQVGANVVPGALSAGPACATGQHACHLSQAQHPSDANCTPLRHCPSLLQHSVPPRSGSMSAVSCTCCPELRVPIPVPSTPHAAAHAQLRRSPASTPAQFVALLYYTASYFPGGAQGVKFLLNMGAGFFSRLVGIKT